MEEEEFDCRSDVGQLIQKMQKLCKKPQLDNQLGSALEVFQEKVTRQKAYLRNGIFNINFAEAALFIQGCAELYGKKIDLLWDEILEFHTRLIEYDCQHEQESGKKVNKEVIEKLEERRNRYKRKKKFKLILAQGNANLLEDYLFDKLAHNEMEAFEADEDSYRNWKKLEFESSLITRIPKAVYKQQTKVYRMKNYYILKSEDFELYDPEDGEFNTKYSRIPGWHVIEHLFEYNTKGLLPDRDKVIATLRLCCYLRAQFMRDNKIPFNAPYSQYKEQYLKFKRKFFEEESKKWQNMPLDTMADLHRQLEYLAKMERETAGEKTTESWVYYPPFPGKKVCNIANCSDCSDESKSTIITISDSLDMGYDDEGKDISKGDVNLSLEKLSSEAIDPKLRQDSGFFELEDQENNMETDELNKTAETSGEATKEPEVTIEGDKSNEVTSKETETTAEGDTANDKEKEGHAITEKNTEVEPTDVENTDKTNEANKNTPASENTGTTPEALNSETDNSQTEQTINETMNSTDAITSESSGIEVKDLAADKESADLENNNDDDDFDVRSVISDHAYCMPSEELTVLKENNNVINKQKSDDMAPLSTKSKIVSKTGRAKVLKENKPKELMGPPPTKRRKLSQKQIEKLMTSKITPVKEMKFEKFFSMNYRPQFGEGELTEVDYESEEEVIPEPEPAPELLSQPEPTAENDNDDLRSIMSDHSYCQLIDVPNDDSQTDLPNEAQNETFNDDQPTNNDSGFVEGNISLEECLDAEELALRCIVPDRSSRKPDSEQLEYERLLAELRASRAKQNEEMNISPGEEERARQKQEQEQLDSQARVEQWKETITPILKNLQEKDFDIHEYGGRIMDGMEIDEKKPFKEIVDGKSSAEVVRYFIASLQLANTYNIDVCGAQSGKLSNDTFEVKLLKRDRYHEHLADYKAPSQESFQERIRKMREELEKEKLEGCNNEIEEPANKRQRTDKSPNKKRIQVSSSDDDQNDVPYTPIAPKHASTRRLKERSSPKNQRVNKTPKKRKIIAATSSDDDDDDDDDRDDNYEPSSRSYQRVNKTTNKTRRIAVPISNGDEVDTFEQPTHSNAPKNLQCFKPSKSKSSPVTPNPIKGKNILARNCSVETNQNMDFSSPSTSGTYQCASELSLSDEDIFESDLAAMQESNPQMQICSTPLPPRPNSYPEPASSSVRILF